MKCGNNGRKSWRAFSYQSNIRFNHDGKRGPGSSSVGMVRHSRTYLCTFSVPHVTRRVTCIHIARCSV